MQQATWILHDKFTISFTTLQDVTTFTAAQQRLQKEDGGKGQFDTRNETNKQQL